MSVAESKVRKTRCAQEFQRWIDANCVVLDTETTGLRGIDEIVEISVIDAAGHTVLDTLVRPSCEIPIEATKIHGITDEMVAGAPTWLDIHDQVIEALTGRVVVIYNAAFDVRLLLQTARINGATETQLAELDSVLRDNVKCAMLLYAEFFGYWDDYRENYRWVRLSSAAANEDVKIEGQAHRALADVKTTLGIMRAVASAHV
ncbi:3'-5' exonuclease [Salmonella enterica subsp. enterica serovar Omuna]|nr:3'-5' exonuclease [Salmonella enterica subsp. enterica serovar Omuna]